MESASIVLETITNLHVDQFIKIELLVVLGQTPAWSEEG
jgi:hypothetical protein